MINKKYLSAVFFLFLITGSIYTEERIVLATGEWKPYISVDYKNFGPYSQIITEAFAIEDIKTVYRFYPWSRAVHLAETGQIDGITAVTKTEKREKLCIFNKKPVFSGKRVFFHLKNKNFKWESIQDLKDFRIGGTCGYFYGTEFEQAEKTGDIFVERTATDRQNFLKLIKGRIDLFPITLEAGYSLLKYEFPDNFLIISHNDRPLTVSPFHLMISKEIIKGSYYIEAFNKGLEKLKKSGRYDEIMNWLDSGEAVY